MKYGILTVLALILVACSPVCPPGTTLGPEGVCCEGKDNICDNDKEINDSLAGLNDDLAEALESEPEEQKDELEEETEPEVKIEAEETEVQVKAETQPAGPTPKPKPAGGQAGLQEFVDTYVSKVKSYSFSHGSNTYKYKNGILTVKLAHPAYKRNVQIGNQTRSLYYFDVIYMNTETQDAKAYCEGYETDLRRECVELEIEDIPLTVDYSEYAITLPHEWLYKWYKNATIESIVKNKYNIQKRAVTQVTTPDLEIFIDPLIGLPLKMIKRDSSGFTEYGSLVTNTVKDYETRHLTYLEALKK